MGAHNSPEHGRRYRCQHQRPTGQVRNHYVRAAPLEETVWTALRELLLDPDRVFAEAEALADAATVQARQLANEVAALEAKRASLVTQQEKLLDCYLQDDTADPALYKKRAAALAAQERDIAATIAAKRAHYEAAAAGAIPVDNIKATCALLAQGMDRLTFEEKRLVLTKLLTRIVALPPTPEAPRGRVRLEGVLKALSCEVSLGCHQANSEVTDTWP